MQEKWIYDSETGEVIDITINEDRAALLAKPVCMVSKLAGHDGGKRISMLPDLEKEAANLLVENKRLRKMLAHVYWTLPYIDFVRDSVDVTSDKISQRSEIAMRTKPVI